MVVENMFSGIEVPTRIVFRDNRNYNDRIGMGIQNKTGPEDQVPAPTCFSFFSVSWLARGNGSYENSLTGQCRPLAAGSVFLRQPGVEHRVHVDTGSGWLEYWLHLGNFAWPFFRNYLSLRDDSLTGQFTPSPEWFSRFDTLMDRLKASPEDALLERAMELCMFAADCVRRTRGGGEEEDMIHRGCEFLGTNFAENRDLRTFCRRNGWGYERFRKLFTDRVGISPNRYRIQRRMAAARSLLAQTYRSVESIAGELGYCSVFDFSAKFKAYTGLSPSEFRKKAREPYKDFFHVPLNLIR